jgi:hypothetical protein
LTVKGSAYGLQQKSPNEKPTSVVESYKTTYGHKADITAVWMSVVEGRAENICCT